VQSSNLLFLASAIIDRIVHNAEVINLEGSRYRLNGINTILPHKNKRTAPSHITTVTQFSAGWLQAVIAIADYR